MHYIVMQLPRELFVMATVNVQTRIDPAIRKEAADVLEKIGLSISDVMRVMLVRIAREHEVPFELFVPNKTTVAAMREARAGGLPSFDSAAELMADLNDEED
jgi:DNA-damage-inducible protein J